MGSDHASQYNYRLNGFQALEAAEGSSELALRYQLVGALIFYSEPVYYSTD